MGPKSTKVANAFPEPILVKVSADQMYVNAAKVNVGAKEVTVGMEMTLDWEKVNKDGYTRIGPQRMLQFDVEIATGKKVAYITIFSEKRGLLICNCFPRREGRPVAVDSEGFLRTVDRLDEAVVLGGTPTPWHFEKRKMRRKIYDSSIDEEVLCCGEMETGDIEEVSGDKEEVNVGEGEIIDIGKLEWGPKLNVNEDDSNDD